MVTRLGSLAFCAHGHLGLVTRWDAGRRVWCGIHIDTDKPDKVGKPWQSKDPLTVGHVDEIKGLVNGRTFLAEPLVMPQGPHGLTPCPALARTAPAPVENPIAPIGDDTSGTEAVDPVDEAEEAYREHATISRRSCI